MPSTPTEFTPFERVLAGARAGIEPYASQLHQARARLVEDALRARTYTREFREAGSRPRELGPLDRRLLDKFLGFPAATRARNVLFLSGFYSDPRARREQRRILQTLNGTAIDAIAFGLGRNGGPGARALLTRRIRELKRELDSKRRPPRALLEAYADCCVGLVFLDPDSQLGADGLVEMFHARHERTVSWNTIAFLRESVTAHPMSFTAPMMRIRDALAELLAPDAAVDEFDDAVHGLMEIDRSRTLARIDALLMSLSKGNLRMFPQHALLGPPPHTALCRWVTANPESFVATFCALRLGDALSPDTRCTIAKHAVRDGSIWSRLDAARLLATTPGAAARALARRFARTERDELVRHVFSERAAHH